MWLSARQTGQSHVEGAALEGRDELPVCGPGRCEQVLASLVREAADETPALAGKLVASSLKSIQAVAAMEGPKTDMPKTTPHGEV